MHWNHFDILIENKISENHTVKELIDFCNLWVLNFKYFDLIVIVFNSWIENNDEVWVESKINHD